MFQKYLKRLLPKGLFARSLLIFILPMVILQLIMVYIFYQRHWESVTRNIAVNLAGDIAYIASQTKDKTPEERQLVLKNANPYLGIDAAFDETPPTFKKRIVLGDEYEFLRVALEKKITSPFSIYEKDDKITVMIKQKEGTLKVDCPKKRLISPTTYIFILWMVGSSVVLLGIGIIFLRNQIRPIVALAEAAEKFGRGQEIKRFKPSGAREVRRAAVAFLAMSKRIRRQISQRTDMLSAVSHDLRSPLTRIKLQLAMLPEGEQASGLQQDVGQMEKMIESYLLFARGEGKEETRVVKISEFISNLVETFGRQNHKLAIKGMGEKESATNLEAKPNALFRAFCNIIDNAFAHAKEVELTVTAADTEINFDIDDNGPGIPEEKRQEVFSAFYRIDKARTPTSGGVGLGLTIARDIVLGHGGDIELDESPLGGLRVKILLPLTQVPA